MGDHQAGELADEADGDGHDAECDEPSVQGQHDDQAMAWENVTAIRL